MGIVPVDEVGARQRGSVGRATWAPVPPAAPAPRARPQRHGRLAGKAVVVTGASRGLGAASAVACAREGAASVALFARSRDDLAAVAAEIRAAGGEALVCPCDVTDAVAVADAIGALERVDVLVNGAGGNQPEPFLDVEPETVEWMWRLNVGATFFATQSAARRMVRQGDGGAIVTISSQMGSVGAPSRTVYCATKHAVEGFTKALAVELAPDGIRALTVAPTFVRTAMTAAQLDDPATSAALLGQIPLGRFATVDDVTAAVVFAASDEAAMLTGSSLVVDGGWTAR